MGGARVINNALRPRLKAEVLMKGYELSLFRVAKLNSTATKRASTTQANVMRISATVSKAFIAHCIN